MEDKELKKDEKQICPKCLKPSTFRIENYSMMWHEGDIYCDSCDQWVRSWDAG